MGHGDSFCDNRVEFVSDRPFMGAREMSGEIDIQSSFIYGACLRGGLVAAIAASGFAPAE
jgi:hypothetical protein